MAVTVWTGGGAVSVRTESAAVGGWSGWLAGWLDVSGSVMTVPVSQGVSVYTNVSVNERLCGLRATGTDAEQTRASAPLLTFGQSTRFPPATAVHLRVTMRRHANVYRAAAARSGQGGPGRVPRASSGGGAPRPALDHACAVACHPSLPA